MHIKTPLLKAYPLSRELGAEVWLKMDALQPSGSFKLRGMGHKAVQAAREGARQFISSSGGNAGLAVAYAGMKLDIPVSVYVPATTGTATIEQLALFGAEVVVTGRHWAEAHAKALAAVTDETSIYFHPFDDELVWAGHASLIDEVIEAGLVPDLIVCSVGGGGLLCGIVLGLERNGLSSIRVLGVETHGADAMNQSQAAGHIVTLPEITSRASSLGAQSICERAWVALSDSDVSACLVTDVEAESACNRFLQQHRVKVELACGAALAAVYNSRHGFIREARSILVVVCGGVVGL